MIFTRISVIPCLNQFWEGQLIPIEVKSADNTRAKSLKVYMDTYKPAYAIKLSARNFGFEDGKKTVPLYAAFCI